MLVWEDDRGAINGVSHSDARRLSQVDKNTHWGDLESEEEESSEEEEEEEQQAEVDTESLADGLTSVVSGYSSLPSGIETPEVLDLRKAKAGGEALVLAGASHPFGGFDLFGGIQTRHSRQVAKRVLPIAVP